MEDSRPSKSSKDPDPTPIDEPEPAHIRGGQDHHDSDDEIEATELRSVSERGSKPRRLSRIISPGKPKLHWHDPFRKLWRHHIRIAVPHVDCRDHLGKCAVRKVSTVAGRLVVRTVVPILCYLSKYKDTDRY